MFTAQLQSLQIIFNLLLLLLLLFVCVCTHVCVCVGMYMHVRMLLGTHVQAGMPMMVSSHTFISAIQRPNSGCQAHKRELLPAESLHEHSSPYS